MTRYHGYKSKFVISPMNSSVNKEKDTARFYTLLGKLKEKTGGALAMAELSYNIDLHRHLSREGVYFSFEPREKTVDGQDRVIRIGESGILWLRLKNHCDSDHHKSVFRKHVGNALMRRHPKNPEWEKIDRWNDKYANDDETRKREYPLEQKVSEYIRNTSVVCLPVIDNPRSESNRKFIECNSIALLSALIGHCINPPSPKWLGHYSKSEYVRRSGLWNVEHVDETYDPEFLNIFEKYINHI